MKFKNKPNKKVKLENGEEVFLARNVSLNALVLYSDEVLLIKRSKNMSEGGKWCLPCGYLDWDETPYQAALRELYEETGLKESDVTPLLKEHNSHEPLYLLTTRLDSPQQNIELTYVFLLEGKHKDLNVPEWAAFEVNEIKWVKTSELSKYDIAFEHDKIIKNLNK